MKCLFCQKGPVHGVNLFRVNAKGQPGVWACGAHIGQTDATVAPDVLAVTRALSTKGQPQ